ncbi:hypothetical protein VKT23_014433 [Stygiomarasmius scandens]|uniref:Uncharacterized protein n=1 Tax=Marasmiellus scandens TaxID=2682957 RepID=A0ABR1J5I0_9AGAR
MLTLAEQNGADILDHLSTILQDRHHQWTRTHPDEPDKLNPSNTTRSQSSFSSYDRQCTDREKQQRDSARESSRIEREDRDRQRSWGGSGASYGPTPAANAAARQAATSSPDDSRQRQQEYLQRGAETETEGPRIRPVTTRGTAKSAGGGKTKRNRRSV